MEKRLTLDEVWKVIENHDDDYCQCDTPNKFLAGLQLLASKTEVAFDDYSAEHDVFYAYHHNDVDLTREDVLQLNKYGWGLDGDDCWRKFM